MRSRTLSDSAAALLACCFVLSGCGDGSDGKDGADGAPGTSMLVRITTEPTGANCVAGGQKLELGADLNGNGQLDDGEVRETRYVCNGSSGPAGAAGAAGAPGASAPEPAPIGRFLATQVIRGALLTCDTVSERNRSIACGEPRVNGVMLVELGMLDQPSGLTSMSSLCRSITGGEAFSYNVTEITTDDSFFASWASDGWHFSQNVIPGQQRVRELNCFSTM